MSLNLKRSISNPDLMVSTCGLVFEADTGKSVPVIRNHPTAVRGPIANYRSAGIYKSLSVQRMVYEAHVKRSRLPNSEQVEPVDGDDMNVNANNLTRSRRRYTMTKTRRSDEPGYSCWMNGGTELYC